MASSDDQPRVTIDAAERRTWRVQRIGWIVLGLVILPAALLGMFGGGPLATVRHEGPGGTLESRRVMRLGVTETWEITLQGVHDSVAVTLDSTFLLEFDVERWVPEPVRTALIAGGLRASFAAATPPHVITVHLAPRAAGMARGTITADGDRWTVSTLVLP